MICVMNSECDDLKIPLASGVSQHFVVQHRTGEIDYCISNCDWDQFFAGLSDIRLSVPSGFDPWLKPPQKIRTGDVHVRSDSRLSQIPEWSVILPSHKHFHELQLTLKGLKRAQKVDTVEVIVLHDLDLGESLPLDGVALENCLQIEVRRSHARTLGDRGFRAGALRNLGGSHARGRNLLFIDADILVPPETFECLNQQLGDDLWLQAKRWHLPPGHPHAERVENLSPVWDAVMSEKGVWESFQNSSGEWNSVDLPWTWASTFFLAITRSRFEALGGFRESFDTYGFEDTEFGYRHSKAGGEFKMLPIDVYHQLSRAEYQSSEDRKQLFKRSAEWFRRWTLDPEVHEWLKRLGY